MHCCCFSQASVSHSVHVWLGGGGGVFRGGRVSPGGMSWEVVMPRGVAHPPGHWTRGGLGVGTQPMVLMAATTCTVGKRAVHILLKCFLEGSETPVYRLYQVSFRKTEEIISDNELLDLLIYDWWRRTRINAADSHLSAVYFQGTWSRWQRLLSEPGPEEPDTLSTRSTSPTDLRYVHPHLFCTNALGSVLHVTFLRCREPQGVSEWGRGGGVEERLSRAKKLV